MVDEQTILNESFNRDKNIKNEILKLAKKFNIEIAIETGTNKGNTTFALSKIFNNVITIEVKPEYFKIAKAKFISVPNIQGYLGNSPDIMDVILPGIERDKKILFYLDAHWYKYNPLLDELNVIKNNCKNPIIVIHDFKVPDRPDFGCDKFPNGKEYTFENIKNNIDNIYGGEKNYHIYYNRVAEGAKRGVIYIVPNK